MDNLEKWEQFRLLAYTFASIGLVFFLLGVYLEAASFGLDDSSLTIISFFGSVTKETGTACGVVAGGLGYLSEDLK